jgi:hypothetical protein
MFNEYPKRTTAIFLTLAGFYLTSSSLTALALFVVGGFCYLSVILHTMHELPPLTAKPKEPTEVPPTIPHVKRKLHFMPGVDPQLVIKQNSQKAETSQQTCATMTNTPNLPYRVKI